MKNEYAAVKDTASDTENSCPCKDSKGNRVSGLDGLRTLAITGVTLFHMFPHTIRGGWLGVSLFFVLTGCLLAYTSEKSRISHSFSLRSYIWKRIKRIYPSLLIMILLTVGIYSILAPDVIKAIRMEVVSVVLGYNNWWQISENADYFTRMANQSPFTHLWFLGIELQYYLLWPLLFGLYVAVSRVLSPRAGTFLFLAGGMAAMGIMPFDFGEGMNMTRLYYGTDTRIYALLLGGALGFYLARRTLSKEMGTFRKSGVSLLYLFALLFTGAGYVLLDGQFPRFISGPWGLIHWYFCCFSSGQRIAGFLLDSSWIILFSAGLANTAMAFSCGSTRLFSFSAI